MDTVTWCTDVLGTQLAVTQDRDPSIHRLSCHIHKCQWSSQIKKRLFVNVSEQILLLEDKGHHSDDLLFLKIIIFKIL